jgi:hypothetical protein
MASGRLCRGAVFAFTVAILLQGCGPAPQEDPLAGDSGAAPDSTIAGCNCSWHSAFDLCVTCCGDVGQAICPTGDACKPGLVYNPATAACDNPPSCSCSWHSAFDLCVTCCGDVGQAICPSGGACKPGLHYDASTLHCELPCSWHQSSFGNCCGDTDQVHCDPLSGDACKPGLAVGDFTCRTPRNPGQTCGPDYPCTDGSSCTLVVDNSALKLECVLDKGNDLVGDPEACRAFYSSDIAAGAVSGNATLNIGVGAVLTAGLAGSIETGVFYTEDSRYGCYTTTCLGVETNIDVSAYAVVGETDTYDDFKGHSFVVNEIAGIEFASYINSQGWNSKEDLGAGKAPVSASQAIAIGIDVLPISAGVSECDTITQVVIGEDTPTPPVALCAAATVIPASGCSAAASVNGGSYSPTSGVTVTAAQSPAGPYPIGNTPVTLTVTDSNGLTASCSTTVTVRDVVPPVISCPADVVVSNTPGRCDAVVEYPLPGATDTCSAVSAATLPPSGTTLPVGVTSVRGLAVDEYLNAASCQFSATVVDAEAPVVTAPPAQVVDATGPDGALVTYPPFVAADNCAVAQVTSAPPSGSVFPINPSPGAVTLVVGSATDAAGNVGTASFAVHVKGAPEQIRDLLAVVEGTRRHHELEEALRRALRAVEAGRTRRACDALGEFVEELAERGHERCPPGEAAALLAAAERIQAVLACRSCGHDGHEGGEGDGVADAR